MKISEILALIYSDIFDYPLKKEEMKKWGIKYKILNISPSIPYFSTKIKKQKYALNLKNFRNQNGYFFIKGRNILVELRKKREKYSGEKIKIAGKIANLLKIIPTVKMVTLTGNVAMKNADKNDDIDFLIIASAGLLWTTRFLTTILMELTGRRRRPKDKEIKNKICLNMFIDENCLRIPENERNLYTAHEIIQLMPLWDRDNTYLKFLKENEWVKEYLPKAIKFSIFNFQFSKNKNKKSKIFFYLIILLEKIFKYLQLWYMRKKKTTEKITDGVIKFHPHDRTKWVLEEYDKRLTKYL